ncbi:hypothetical protein CMV_027721, partial [Castanea mollissima]
EELDEPGVEADTVRGSQPDVGVSRSVNGSAWSSGHRHMWCGFDGDTDGFTAVVVEMVWVFGLGSLRWWWGWFGSLGRIWGIFGRSRRGRAEEIGVRDRVRLRSKLILGARGALKTQRFRIVTGMSKTEVNLKRLLAAAPQQKNQAKLVHYVATLREQLEQLAEERTSEGLPRVSKAVVNDYSEKIEAIASKLAAPLMALSLMMESLHWRPLKVEKVDFSVHSLLESYSKS